MCNIEFSCALFMLLVPGLAPAPFAGMLLQAHGARVVRVDRTTPALYPDFLGRGKESIALDLKQKKGVDIFKRLASRCDVVLDPFRPGVLERAGAGPHELLTARPDMVLARITGYGQSSAFAHRPGHDINYLATSGVLSLLARRGAAPTPPANLLADFAGGGLMAVAGILMAAWSAQRTGRGSVVDVSMTDSCLLLAQLLLEFRAAGLHSAPPGCNLLDTGAPFYETYATCDGGYMAVGALEPHFFRSLLSALGTAPADMEFMCESQMDPSAWPTIRKHLQTAFASESKAHWTSHFSTGDAQQACVTPVVTLSELPTSPHWESRSAVGRRLRKVQHSGMGHASSGDTAHHVPAAVPASPGPLWLPQSVPAVYRPGRDEEGGEAPPSTLHDLPEPGQHTVSVLRELAGCSANEAHELLREGVAVQQGEHPQRERAR